MNKFYFNDKTERIELVKPANGYTLVETSKDFDKFVEDFEHVREEGNSIIDSIEWVK